MMFDPIHVGLALISVSILISVSSWLPNFPLVGIANRWLRWISLSLLLAYGLRESGLLIRPIEVLLAVSLLFWLLLETVYNWLLVNALSRSEMPLFPRYQDNPNANFWPITKPALLLKSWLEAQGFSRVATLFATIADPIRLDSVVFLDEARHVRCQVLFFPRAREGFTLAFVLTSITPNDEVVVTDNVFMPSGVYYPEGWFLKRYPLHRSLEPLLRKHQRRLTEFDIKPKPFEIDNQAGQLNAQQRELEMHNRKMGFLHDPVDTDDHGRISWEGRYRLWKEILLLNYLGRTINN